MGMGETPTAARASLELCESTEEQHLPGGECTYALRVHATVGIASGRCVRRRAVVERLTARAYTAATYTTRRTPAPGC